MNYCGSNTVNETTLVPTEHNTDLPGIKLQNNHSKSEKGSVLQGPMENYVILFITKALWVFCSACTLLITCYFFYVTSSRYK